jgi:hypothetical protein
MYQRPSLLHESSVNSCWRLEMNEGVTIKLNYEVCARMRKYVNKSNERCARRTERVRICRGVSCLICRALAMFSHHPYMEQLMIYGERYWALVNRPIHRFALYLISLCPTCAAIPTTSDGDIPAVLLHKVLVSCYMHTWNAFSITRMSLLNRAR